MIHDNKTNIINLIRYSKTDLSQKVDNNKINKYAINSEYNQKNSAADKF